MMGVRTRRAASSSRLIQPLLQDEQKSLTVCRYGGCSPISRGRPFSGPAMCRAGLRSKPILLTHWPKTCSRVSRLVEPQKAQESVIGPFSSIRSRRRKSFCKRRLVARSCLESNRTWTRLPGTQRDQRTEATASTAADGVDGADLPHVSVWRTWLSTETRPPIAGSGLGRDPSAGRCARIPGATPGLPLLHLSDQWLCLRVELVPVVPGKPALLVRPHHLLQAYPVAAVAVDRHRG